MDDVIDYSVRVGSTVGVMMTLVMGAGDTHTLTAACRLGVAMQLTNIARDVGEDACAGRLYLPGEVLREHGVDPDAWLASPVASEGIRGAVCQTLDDADRLYAAAWPGIGELPSRSRAAIRAAALVYAEIGRKVREADCDSVTRRVWTGRLEKVRLLGRALRGRPGAWVQAASQEDDSQRVGLADERAAFLVDAVARS
jgi:phytoene synthase